jgi:hypothetical protein
MKRDLVRRYTKQAEEEAVRRITNVKLERFGSNTPLRAFDFARVHTPSIPSKGVREKERTRINAYMR